MNEAQAVPDRQIAPAGDGVSIVPKKDIGRAEFAPESIDVLDQTWELTLVDILAQPSTHL